MTVEGERETANSGEAAVKRQEIRALNQRHGCYIYQSVESRPEAAAADATAHLAETVKHLKQVKQTKRLEHLKRVKRP